MALNDNFNSYSDGDINGQGSWTGSGGITIQGTTYVTTKAVQVSTGTFGENAYKDFTADATGDQTFYTRYESGSGYCYAEFRNANRVFYVNTNENSITLNGSTSSNIVAIISAGTWYKIQVQWDATNGVRARVDDGSWGSYMSFENALSTGITRVRLIADAGSGTFISYYDDFKDNNAVSFTPIIIQF